MSDCEMLTLTAPNHIKYLQLIEACVAELCQIVGRPPEEAYALQLAIHEACTNVIEHAHGGDASAQVKLSFALGDDCLEIDVYDWGKGFDLTLVANHEPETLHERGYGLAIIKGVMNEVSYVRDPAQGNRLHLVKRFDGG